MVMDRSLLDDLKVNILTMVSSRSIFAAAALLCVTLTQYLASKETEVYSEILCWTLLSALFRVTNSGKTLGSSRTKIPFQSVAERPVSSRSSLWIAALGLAVATVFRAEHGTIKLYPLLTPILLSIQKYVLSLPSSTKTISLFDFNHVGTALAIAMGAVLPVMMGCNLLTLAFSCIPLLALLPVFAAFMSKSTRPARFIPDIDLGYAVPALSWRIVMILICTLALQTAIFEMPRPSLARTIVLCLFKALSWFFTAQAAHHTTWCIATSIGAYGILATNNPFKQTSEFQVMSQIVASILFLWQIASMLGKHAKYRRAIVLFSLVPVIAYISYGIAIRGAIKSASWSPELVKLHPIERLVFNAQAEFQDLVHKQSKSYEAAHEAYQRRYNMEPPPGFQEWYEYAVEHKSLLIDDFDMIYNQVSPFWKLSGKEVEENMRNVHQIPGVDLWACTLMGERTRSECSHPYRLNDRSINFLFQTLLQTIPATVSEVRILVNHLDEPTVLLPSSQSIAIDKNRQVKLENLSKQATWDAITANCDDLESRIRHQATTSDIKTHRLPWVTSHQASIDLCAHPEYKNMHGLLMSPTSFKLIEGFVPILTTGSLSTMGDLLHPSAAYMEPRFIYDNTKDMPWDQKQNRLYWTGSTTGAFANSDQWPNYHRQRFVKFVQQLEKNIHYYLHTKGDVITRTASSFLNSRLYDVAFTNIVGSTWRYWRQQRQYFGLQSWADKDDVFKSRLVFDLDGNGISGRYYKLLASNSVPLKQTILREWHDERLVPWVHYVPVSLSMEELPELVMYLTSTKKGQQRAKEIAEQGKEWFGRAMRVEDQSVYFYRLLLELARLQDPTRLPL